MTRVKNFAGLGSTLPADLNTIQDDYEQLYRQWRILHHVNKHRLEVQNSTNRHALKPTNSPDASDGSFGEAPGNSISSTYWSGRLVFYWDPADYPYEGRSLSIRLRSTQMVGTSTLLGSTCLVEVVKVVSLVGNITISASINATAVAGLTITHTNTLGVNMQAVTLTAAETLAVGTYVVTAKHSALPNNASRAWLDANVAVRIE